MTEAIDVVVPKKAKDDLQRGVCAVLGRIFGVVGASGAAEYVDTLTSAGAENVAFG